MSDIIRLKKLYPILVTVTLVILLYSLSRSIPQEKLRFFIDNAGTLGPAIFILLLLLTYVVAPISGSPLLFVGFYAFGPTVVFFIVTAALIAQVVNFWIARRWGRPIVEKFVGRGGMHKIDKLTQNYGVVTLFALRVFQGGIHDFVSYAAGLTAIKFPVYILVSWVAVIPGTLFWFFWATQINDPLIFTLVNFVLATISSAIFILGVIIIKRWRYKKERL